MSHSSITAQERETLRCPAKEARLYIKLWDRAPKEEAINKKNRLSIQIYSSAAPRPSLCPLELTEAEIKRRGDKEGRDEEEWALCIEREEKEKKRKGKTSDWGPAGWGQKLEKSQTPGETQGHRSTAVCCQAAFHRAREPHRNLHTATAPAHHLNL